MGVKRQIVRVSDEGVQEVIRDLERVNAGLDRTSRNAQRTAAEVDAAQGKGAGLTGFLQRARAGGFFKRSGVEFGPLEIGRAGIGMNQSFLRSGMGSAGVVVMATAHAAAGTLGMINNMRDAIAESGSVLEGISRGYRRRSGDIIETITSITGAKSLTRELFRAFGVKGDVFDEALEQAKDDLFTTAEEKRLRKEKEARAKARMRALEEQAREEERRAEQALLAKIRAMQDKIDGETNRALARLYRTRQLGIRFWRGEDQERAERQIDELNERTKRLEAENEKQKVAAMLKNKGA